MSTAQLRRDIKKAVDRVPPERLVSLADYIQYLAGRTLAERIARAEKDLSAGKGVNWRKVRKDV
jgi:hypothetical protein